MKLIRRLRVLLTAICVLSIAVAVAIEPSNIIVTKDGKPYYKHKVEAGQTLYALSKAYNVTEQQIVECNDGLTAEGLRAGEYILVPCVEAVMEEAVDTDERGKFITYEVKAGDTIYYIARRYKISVEVLERDNPTIDVDHIAIGAKVKVRRSESGYATTADIEREREKRSINATLAEDEHRVVAGETVYSLSRAYGMSEREFMELNNLKRNSSLKAGMVVKTVKPNREKRDNEEVVTLAPAEDVKAGKSTEVVADSLAVAAYDYFMGGDEDSTIYVKPAEVTFPPLSRYHTLNVALMLPFHQKERVNPYYVDFYRGVLMAMDDLKSEGYSIEMSVFDTRGDSNRIGDIVAYEQGFIDAQLIIGPVYEAELRYVLGHAEENDIPVVSPLADIESLQSSVLFQMQAENDYKYSKIEGIFDGKREVVTIYSGATDESFAQDMSSLSAVSPKVGLNFVFDREAFFYYRNDDGTNGAEVDIIEFMRTKSTKAFVVVAANETDVDRILTTLASTKAAIEGRGMTHGDYVVVGNRRWMQSANIEHQSFFRNNTIFTLPYHAKRSDEAVRIFDSRYIKAYGVLPTMYSYRGYDAAMIFCRKMFTGIDSTIFEERFTPLATTYEFVFENGHYINRRWVREHYKSDFTIEVQ